MEPVADNERPDTPLSNESNESYHSLVDRVEDLKLSDSSGTVPAGDVGTSCQDTEAAFNDAPEFTGSDLNSNEYDNEDESAVDGDCREPEDAYFVDELYLKDMDVEITEEEAKNKQSKAGTLKDDGNSFFKQGSFAEAASLYTEGLKVCPYRFSSDRSILYANRAAARAKLGKEELKGAIGDCDKALELNPDYMKALIRRAQLHELAENLDEALKDYQKILERDPSNSQARVAVMRLPDQINERNEKLKTEMLSKLKDLGNMVLRPFGLSTDNFELKQDSGTGGYNINFKPSS